MTLELEARHRGTKALHWRKPLPTSVFGIRRRSPHRSTVTPDPSGLVEACGKPVTTTEWWDVDDETLSSLHVVLEPTAGQVRVRRVTRPKPTTNRLRYLGQEWIDEFDLRPGEFFETGNTVFRLVGPDVRRAPSERTIPASELSRMLEDSDARLERLAGLPETIRFCTQPETLDENFLDTLLKGVPSAGLAALVALEPDSTPEAPRVTVLRRAGRATALVPSGALVHNAVRRDGLPVSHIWPDGPPTDSATPLDERADWALCVPLPDSEPTRGWALYLAGRFPAARDPAVTAPALDDAIRFTALSGQFYASLRQVLYLRKRQVQLGNYLGPAVVKAVAGREIDDALRPRVIRAAVLLCDLRGFSRAAEQGSDDLMQLLRRVSAALDVMTTFIVRERGVVGDFQGDSALGFWGWPPGDHDDAVARAAGAALAISGKFAQAARSEGTFLDSFACGIGLAAGPAVAGRIGTLDQFKVGVFGPVVNLAARLEGMTKRFGVPVIVDRAFADDLRTTSPRTASLRRLASVQPAGMSQIHEVFELLPPDLPPELAERCRRYEKGLDEFLAGQWDRAGRTLAPLAEDGPSRFLKGVIAGRDRPPEGWPGYVALDAK